MTKYIKMKALALRFFIAGTAFPCVRYRYLDILHADVRHPHAGKIHMRKVSVKGGWTVSISGHPGQADCSGPLAYEGPKGHGMLMPIARKGANCLSKCDRWFAKRLLCAVLPGILMVTGPPMKCCDRALGATWQTLMCRAASVIFLFQQRFAHYVNWLPENVRVDVDFP